MAIYQDWGDASEAFDNIEEYRALRDLATANEAQTRFDVIDRIVKEILGWQHGQINVEERAENGHRAYVDYILRDGDNIIVIEAKRVGATFPSPTVKQHLKLSGSVLGQGEVKEAIEQAKTYGRVKDADVVVTTNGLCWIFFSMHNLDDSSSAYLLFPFEEAGHAEKLYSFFAVANVAKGSLSTITNTLPNIEYRLLSAVRNADGRVDRNNIANAIMPALHSAFYADALVTIGAS